MAEVFVLIATAAQLDAMQPLWGAAAFLAKQFVPFDVAARSGSSQIPILDLQAKMWHESHEAAVRATNFQLVPDEQQVARYRPESIGHFMTSCGTSAGPRFTVPKIVAAVKSMGKMTQGAGSSSGAARSSSGASPSKTIDKGHADKARCSCGKWFSRRALLQCTLSCAHFTRALHCGLSRQELCAEAP